jgi:hypothetical protein
MRLAVVISQIFFLISLSAYTGCESPQTDTKPPAQAGKTSLHDQPAPPPKQPAAEASETDARDYSGYMAAKVDIMPLTEFISTPDVESPMKLRIYVSLLDSFNCQMKSPGIFRFELYEHVLRSPEPHGRRVAIWPDIDLTDAADNNHYWRDFLRAYEFNLDFELKARQSYILQATFLTSDGRRLLDEFIIE